MKKLIKLFNNQYGKYYGIIDDDYTKEESYQIYNLIKKISTYEDSEIQEELKKVILDKPQSVYGQINKLKIKAECDTIQLDEFVNIFANQNAPRVTQPNFGELESERINISEPCEKSVFYELCRIVNLSPKFIVLGDGGGHLTITDCSQYDSQVNISASSIRHDYGIQTIGIKLELSYENDCIVGVCDLTSYYPHPNLNFRFSENGTDLLVTINNETKIVALKPM